MDLSCREKIDQCGSQVRFCPILFVVINECALVDAERNRFAYSSLGGAANGSRSSISGRRQRGRREPVLVDRTASMGVGTNDFFCLSMVDSFGNGADTVRCGWEPMVALRGA